ncbi:hypothetical protein ACQ5SO_05360 [Rhodovulum sp. DZ06]|uniref:hypothetical protein n=1 Tax=Rhodovulum sp. DZ06 TaxID=3425126 RepID=UPI003D329A28
MKAFIFAGALLGAVSAAEAATVEIEARQVGGDVVLTGTGSVDLAGLSLAFPSADYTAAPSQSTENFFIGAGAFADVYSIADPGFVPMNDTGFVFTSVSGDIFALQGSIAGALNPFVMAPEGYVSGETLSFTWTVAGTTLAALDLNYGTLGAFGNNTVTLSRAVSDVPLPPALGLLALAAGALGGLARRGRRGRSAA